MDDLLEALTKGTKLSFEQWVGLFLECSKISSELEELKEQFISLDAAIHFTNAVRSGMCFPYFTTMLLNDKAVAFKLSGDDIQNYDNDDFGRDMEKCSPMKYLTPDPCFYIEKKPRVAVQDSMMEELSFRERILGFSAVNSYDLGCIVDVIQYGLPTENVELPGPSRCKAGEIMLSWLKEDVKKESPFELESRHYKRFKSFFKVPGLKVYFPSHDFGDPKERGLEEVRHFQEYFAKKVLPKLEKLCG